VGVGLVGGGPLVGVGSVRGGPLVGVGSVGVGLVGGGPLVGVGSVGVVLVGGGRFGGVGSVGGGRLPGVGSATIDATSGMTGARLPGATRSVEVAPGALAVPLAGLTAGRETDLLGSLAATGGCVLTRGVVFPAGLSTMGGGLVSAATAPIAAGATVAATTQTHTKVRTAVRGAGQSTDTRDGRARSGPNPLERQSPTASAADNGGRPPARRLSAILSVGQRTATCACRLRNSPFIGSSITLWKRLCSATLSRTR
jgi:hypothetical protein